MSRIAIQDISDYPEDRIIERFPGPYLTDCSPYLTRRFNNQLRNYLIDYNTSKNYLNVSKVIVIGDVSVGKTCLVNSWDTAGQERFKSIAQSYYRGAHAVVIVFDLTNPDTLYNSQTWLNEASQTFSSNVPFLFLVGTKKDLLKQYAYKNLELCSIKMATKMNAEYWAVSSKTGKNISNLFRRIAALTFAESIKMEIESGKNTKEIGTKLKSLDIKQKSQDAGHCASKKCVK